MCECAWVPNGDSIVIKNQELRIHRHCLPNVSSCVAKKVAFRPHSGMHHIIRCWRKAQGCSDLAFHLRRVSPVEFHFAPWRPVPVVRGALDARKVCQGMLWHHMREEVERLRNSGF